jgi:putative hydrolase of the HAD superfamily
VLNSSDFGVAKPDPRAYAAAHAAIEADLGRELGREQVWFTDDRAENVDAAREFGWGAELFTLTRKGAPPAG